MQDELTLLVEEYFEAIRELGELTQKRAAIGSKIERVTDQIGKTAFSPGSKFTVEDSKYLLVHGKLLKVSVLGLKGGAKFLIQPVTIDIAVSKSGDNPSDD